MRKLTRIEKKVIKKTVKVAKKNPVVAVLLVLAVLLGIGTYVYLNRDTLAEQYFGRVAETTAEEVTTEASTTSGGTELAHVGFGKDLTVAGFTVPDYTDSPFYILNDNVPLFTATEKTVTVSFETYPDLDALGRCGVCYACVGKDLMPTEAREEISSVYPSGWKYNGTSNNHKYSFVDAQYIYNRCHLIGFQLTGENANKKNLITGTRYLNIDGMLDFENMIADYIKEHTANHVLYRVTPVFEGDNLVCYGLLLEGYSVEDEGDGICFCVFSYNVQPGVVINYATGENALAE